MITPMAERSRINANRRMFGIPTLEEDERRMAARLPVAPPAQPMRPWLDPRAGPWPQPIPTSGPQNVPVAGAPGAPGDAFGPPPEAPIYTYPGQSPERRTTLAESLLNQPGERGGMELYEPPGGGLIALPPGSVRPGASWRSAPGGGGIAIPGAEIGPPRTPVAPPATGGGYGSGGGGGGMDNAIPVAAPMAPPVAPMQPNWNTPAAAWGAPAASGVEFGNVPGNVISRMAPGAPAAPPQESVIAGLEAQQRAKTAQRMGIEAGMRTGGPTSVRERTIAAAIQRQGQEKAAAAERTAETQAKTQAVALEAENKRKQPQAVAGAAGVTTWDGQNWTTTIKPGAEVAAPHWTEQVKNLTLLYNAMARVNIDPATMIAIQMMPVKTEEQKDAQKRAYDKIFSGGDEEGKKNLLAAIQALMPKSGPTDKKEETQVTPASSTPGTATPAPGAQKTKPKRGEPGYKVQTFEAGPRVRVFSTEG